LTEGAGRLVRRRRRPLKAAARSGVSDRWVKTVDAHAHCAVPAAMALMGRNLETEAPLIREARGRLRAMDAPESRSEVVDATRHAARPDCRGGR
jgi:hypothetical protein